MENTAEYNLTGYIAGTHYKGNSHFMGNDGIVLCGSKSKWLFDASIEIRFRTLEDFDHDQTPTGNPYDRFRANHLPLRCYITCKKCQKLISIQLKK